MTPQELKRSQTSINQLRQEIGQAETKKRSLTQKISEAKQVVNDLQRQVTEHDRAISNARAEIEKIEKKSGQKSKGKVGITEHAMLRYVERVIGIGLDDLEKKILPEGSAETISGFGDGEFPVGEHRVRVKNGKVVTVIV